MPTGSIDSKRILYSLVNYSYSIMKNTSLEKHNTGIDTLRGISILSVLLLHLNIQIPFKNTFIGSITPKMMYTIFFFSGFYGVCIFFVISGFLITTSVLKKWGSLPQISITGFYSMRFARIIPLLISLIIILSLLHLTGVNGFIINPERASLGDAIFAALTFHINWLELTRGYLPGSWDILWSLSIEEFFYIFFPLVCFLARKERNIIFVMSIFLLISPFARTVWFTWSELADRNYFAFMDAIALGCIAAIAAHRVVLSKKSLLSIKIVGLILFLLIMLFRRVVYQMGLTGIGLNITFLAIGTALLLIWMQKRFLSGEQKSSRLTSYLRYLGRNSYEVYLTHMFVVIGLVALFRWLNLSGEWIWGLYITAVAVSGLLGDFVAKYFSNPINLKLRAWFKSKQDSHEIVSQ